MVLDASALEQMLLRFHGALPPVLRSMLTSALLSEAERAPPDSIGQREAGGAVRHANRRRLGDASHAEQGRLRANARHGLHLGERPRRPSLRRGLEQAERPAAAARREAECRPEEWLVIIYIVVVVVILLAGRPSAAAAAA